MPKFTRTKEDFICRHCGAKVLGNGYTNHCPECLWSKHVDVNPGDRSNVCGGMMKPLSVEMEHGEYVLIHRCQTCGKAKRNKALKTDSFEALIVLSTAA